MSGIESVESTIELISLLKETHKESKTAQVWIKNFLQPLFIVLRFIRAEREGEWLLHLATVREMIPYFFAAGHEHYARHATSYLLEMEALPPGGPKDRFMNGEFTTRLTEALWNNIFSDMMIETTYMRIGKAPGGSKARHYSQSLLKDGPCLFTIVQQ